MISDEVKVIERLRYQVEKQGCSTEIECAKELSEISHILLPHLDELYYIDKEIICHAGRADLTIIANRRGPGGKRRVAYVWELKAPQLPLFKMETKERACPYAYLFAAENQLLHYHYELANGTFTERWNIAHDDVLLGGIIIGRNDNFIKKKNEREDKKAEVQAKIAMDIRTKSFYRPNNMALLTWDQVLWMAEKFLESHRYLGDPNALIDYSASVPFTIPPEE